MTHCTLRRVMEWDREIRFRELFNTVSGNHKAWCKNGKTVLMRGVDRTWHCAGTLVPWLAQGQSTKRHNAPSILAQRAARGTALSRRSEVKSQFY
ncbi:hypothetical protein HAX54_003801 [Datura stramonium]|uniref:Uncharacterized protein n=1 Tax=Datura stramonium TaxID=4076 RepID=A0ABS8WWC2_DATST|nr:hypothetical protein [Datura stramonium]